MAINFSTFKQIFCAQLDINEQYLANDNMAYKNIEHVNDLKIDILNALKKIAQQNALPVKKVPEFDERKWIFAMTNQIHQINVYRGHSYLEAPLIQEADAYMLEYYQKLIA